jgi:hypothetical protein
MNQTLSLDIPAFAPPVLVSIMYALSLIFFMICRIQAFRFSGENAFQRSPLRDLLRYRLGERLSSL